MTALQAMQLFTQSQAGSNLAHFGVALCEICDSPLEADADDKICTRHRAEVNHWTTRAMNLHYADLQARKAESRWS